jgi:hypothetical protein
LISEKAFCLLLAEEKLKRAGEGEILANSGKKEIMVNEEVEDLDYKDNKLLGQPDKPLNLGADSSSGDVSRLKEEK